MICLTMNTCVTASKLYLDIKLDDLSISLLAATFPAIVDLSVEILPGNMPLFPRIFQLWPDLEVLEIGRESMQMCPNRDAEFCGISREELDTYYGKDEEFLTALQIVPIAPCIATLKSLRSLTVDRYLPKGLTTVDELSNPKNAFLSTVTDLLVFKRLPLLKVNIGSDRWDDSDDSASESDSSTDSSSICSSICSSVDSSDSTATSSDEEG